MIAVASSPAPSSRRRPGLAALVTATARIPARTESMEPSSDPTRAAVLPSPACHADIVGAATLLTRTRRTR
jgi:hypothetical protein